MILERWRAQGISLGVAAHNTQKIIAIGFTLVLVLMALLTGLGLSHMASINARMADLVTESSVKIESVYQMRSVSRERFASLGQIVVLKDPFERDDESMRFQALASDFIRARDRLLSLGMGPEEQATWAQARELIQRDEQLHAQVIELALMYQEEAAMEVLLREVRPIENQLLETLNEMVEQYRRANQQSLRESEEDYRVAVRYMLGLAALALVMGLVIAWLVIQRSRYTELQLSRQNQAVVAAAEQLSWAASHDPLTGLSNRREMERRLNELIQDTHAQGARHALLYIDLDRFKAVNDRCGHFAGDELLQKIAHIFTQHVRSGDLVARLGGDEFCVGLVNCEHDKAFQIAEAIRDEIAQFRFVWEGQEFQIGASIGLVYLDPSMNIEAALRAADAACYQAKELGRNRVSVFGPSYA